MNRGLQRKAAFAAPQPLSPPDAVCKRSTIQSLQ